MILKVPEAILWRKKDVLGLGVVTPWAFRRATETGRLRGKLLPGRVKHLYPRDAVIRAFGMKPCDDNGRPADAVRCTCVEV